MNVEKMCYRCSYVCFPIITKELLYPCIYSPVYYYVEKCSRCNSKVFWFIPNT